MTRDAPPPEIVEAARRRSAARAARDWATADRLRAEIEAAGWRVVDAGTVYRLEATHPPEVVEGEVVRYGRSEAVPSRLDQPDDGPATVVIIGTEHAAEIVVRALAAVRRVAPAGLSMVVVADGMDGGAEAEVERALGVGSASMADSETAAAPGATDPRTSASMGTGPGLPTPPVELIRTSARLGHAAALNIGIRRSIGSTVILLDPGIEPEGDIVTPLVRVLDDPTVALAGPLGLGSADVRTFEKVIAAGPAPVPATAIEGHLMAFRRADAAARGPLDEQFRFSRYLDIWWSLVLRDEGEGRTARSALVVPDLPLRRHEQRGGTSVTLAERERLSKRNFYRVLDRIGRRLDLAVPGA
ncbi:MAG TPA: hypothetical protein VEX41_04100 [Candidatus Eisenbacteria bacterium]|nr:hypothetical protein [Candidatus Eisenbacteria bacterium]